MDKPKYRLVQLSLMTGTFLIPINSTMIAVALPIIAGTVDVSLPQASWVVTIYLIVMTAVQPIGGKMGDQYGKRNIFLVGMLLFLIASAACTFSNNLLWLIVFRALQAIGGAIASPNAGALIREVFPKEKLGAVFGNFGLFIGLGAAIGPLVSSVLIGWWGWQSIFWVNLPFALFSLLTGYACLPRSRKCTKASLDIPGSLYLIVIFTVLVLAVTHPRFFNLWVMALLVVTVALFIRQERRSPDPLVRFTLFKIPMFSSANIATLLNNAIIYSTILVMPVLLQEQNHFTVQQVGLLLFVYSFAMSACSWIGGSLTEKWGKGKLVLLCFLISGLALVGYLSIYPYPAFTYIAVVLFLGGVGAGIGSPAIQTASLQEVPRETLGAASGIFAAFRCTGAMAGSVMVGIIDDYHWLFYALMLLSAIGLPLSRRLNYPE